MIGFGVLDGARIGFAYASITPATLRWFTPDKSSIVSAIVVSGFAIASLYIAPYSTNLVNNQGLENSMRFFVIDFFLLISLLAMFLILLPKGFKHTGFQDRHRSTNKDAAADCEFR